MFTRSLNLLIGIAIRQPSKVFGGSAYVCDDLIMLFTSASIRIKPYMLLFGMYHKRSHRLTRPPDKRRNQPRIAKQLSPRRPRGFFLDMMVDAWERGGIGNTQRT